eukprot:2466455-Pyramimonas_sp.AAC.1
MTGAAGGPNRGQRIRLATHGSCRGWMRRMMNMRERTTTTMTQQADSWSWTAWSTSHGSSWPGGSSAHQEGSWSWLVNSVDVRHIILSNYHLSPPPSHRAP